MFEVTFLDDGVTVHWTHDKCVTHFGTYFQAVLDGDCPNISASELKPRVTATLPDEIFDAIDGHRMDIDTDDADEYDGSDDEENMTGEPGFYDC